MEAVEECNLCGGRSFSLFAELDGPVTQRRFRVVRCAGCGLQFVATRLTTDENAALYGEPYFNGKGFDTSVNYVSLDGAADAREEENAGVLEKIATLKPGRGIRVLDFGCGTGALLRALVGAGYTDVWGVELSPYAAAKAAGIAGARVFAGELLAADLPRGSFDLINATEVIEHVRDPLACFGRIRELLAPGGVFVYSTGNARGLYARLLGKRWPYLHPEGHLFYFDPQTLTRYFLRVGLEPISWRALEPAQQRTFLAAESRMARSVLKYVGHCDPGFKGHVFRAVGALESPWVHRAVAAVVGKQDLPLGIRSS